MAYNYNFREGTEIISAGVDTEKMLDIGKRFPLTSMAISKIAATAGDNFMALAKVMPEYITMQKIEKAFKAGISGVDSEDAESDSEAPVADGNKDDTQTEKKPVKVTEDAEKPAPKKRGRKPKAKPVEEPAPVEDTEDEAEEENEEATPYDGKTAMDLFKECKKRGIKAQPKKPAKFYVDMLIADDKAKAEEDTEDDDWGEDEDEAPVPVKKAPEAPAKKKPVEDDDDDWDI